MFRILPVPLYKCCIENKLSVLVVVVCDIEIDLHECIIVVEVFD